MVWRLSIALLITLIVAQMIFAAWPGLDLLVSRLFVDGTGRFVAAQTVVATANDLLREAMEMATAAALVFTMLLWAGRFGSHAALRCAIFLSANLVLAPGVIVNLLLKAHLGRARPVQVTEFGGTAQFTPAWQISDQCARNCSFTSGEVSLAATLALCAVVLLWPRFTPGGRLAMLVTAIGFVLCSALLRIALGRHFLSDAVFSVLISACVALGLYLVLLKGKTPQGSRDLRGADLRTPRAPRPVAQA